MTTEQKAKAYDEALKRARQFSEHPLQEDSSNIVEYIFPELQESKDERIRKEIIETFKILGDGKIPVDINYADIFTWLEKQGGQKPAWSEEDEEFLRRAINATKDAYPVTANWLQSLRPKNQWKPSEEQMKALHDLNLTGNISYAGQGQVLIELYNDLKKLAG